MKLTAREIIDEKTGDLVTSCGSAVRGEFSVRLPLRHADAASVLLQYEFVGSRGSPLIVAGGISADRHIFSSPEFPEAGWWEVQRPSLAPQQHRILAINWVGSDSAIDVPIDPADQADALAAMMDHLGIDEPARFIGASYGGMVGMHMAVRHPQRLAGLLAISAGAQSHPFASACRSLQRQAISLGEAAGHSEAGVALARAMAILTYRTPEEFEDRFSDPPAVTNGLVTVAADAYLASHGARHSGRMTAVAYRRLSESIDLHRVEPSTIRVPLNLVAVDRDALVPPEDVRSLAEIIPGSRFHLINSHYGHDAFLKEEAQVGAIISEFLSSLEQDHD